MEAKKRLIDTEPICEECGLKGCYNCQLCKVGKAPTVDAVEVVHGRWLQSVPGYRICSHCMADVAIYSGHKNYCPNCGAKMDRERKMEDGSD